MKKKLLTMLAVIVLGMVLVCGVSAEVAEDYAWSLDEETGTLTISGHGEMPNYEYNPDYERDLSPWYSKKDRITKVIINNGITWLSNNAFSSCVNLTSIIIPDSVLSIGYQTFARCESLTDITIPDSVLYIGRMAFSNCGLTNITIPDGIEHINVGVFAFCENLTTITLPNRVKSIEWTAFAGCSRLTDIVIPSSVTSIQLEAFRDCDSLTDVYYAGSESEWNSIIEETWNDSLLTATIHFNYTSDPPRSATVFVNGSRVFFPDQQPFLKDSRTLVPARGVFEAFGASVSWDDATETVTVSRGDTLVTLTIGQSFITVNGVKKAQDVPAQLINDRTMIPVRAVAEAFGCNVGWDDATYTVTIDA